MICAVIGFLGATPATIRRLRVPDPHPGPTPAALLPAFDVDFNARCEGNRVWTVYDDAVEQPVQPGDLALAVCIESGQDGGFGVLCRVHEVSRVGSHTGWFVSFDWLPEHDAPREVADA